MGKTNDRRDKKLFIINCPKCHGVVAKESAMNGTVDVNNMSLEMRCPHCHTNLAIHFFRTLNIEVGLVDSK